MEMNYIQMYFEISAAEIRLITQFNRSKHNRFISLKNILVSFSHFIYFKPSGNNKFYCLSQDHHHRKRKFS